MMRRVLTGVKLLVLMAVLLSVSALFMMGYAAVTSTDYFRAQSITVGGQSRLSRDLILDQAGIKAGDNLLAVNLKLVRKRLLAHPWIASARVAREIPQTISIVVHEHTPLAVLDLGRKFLLNTEGRIFKEYGPADPKRLPLVSGIAYGDISLGDDALTPQMAAVLAVIQVTQDKKSALPYKTVKEINIDAQMGITLYVGERKRRISLGTGGYRAKFERIRQLLPHLEQNAQWRKFSAIDANNPNRIVVQL